ncbi:MAG: hypothetical protein JWM64_1903, partial [Frankiales bacterium]|nr:hypothetical protein [Frankiales bacterium]
VAAQRTDGPPPPVSSDGSAVVVPRDGRTTVRLRARNAGNVVWPADGTVQLGTSAARDRTSPSRAASWPAPNRAAASSTRVAPGGTGSFDLVLEGAGRPAGLTFEQFEPVWSGRHWLDGAVTRLAVVRTDPGAARLAMLHSAPTTLSVEKGGTAVLVVRLRNLGGQPWTVGKEQLTTSAAEPLRTSAWTSATRPPALALNASRPSVKAVYPGEIGEWRVPLLGRTAGTHTITLQGVLGSAGYGPRTATKTTVSP